MTTFDTELVETAYIVQLDGPQGQPADFYGISIYKLGGGTVGQAYEGLWGYEIVDGKNQVITAGEDLHTGMPKTHQEVAELALTFQPDPALLNAHIMSEAEILAFALKILQVKDNGRG